MSWPGARHPQGDDKMPKSTATPSPTLRLYFLSDGPATSPKTNSGVALGLYRALQAHPEVNIVGTADASFSKGERLLVRLLSFRFAPSHWRVVADWGSAGPLVRSVKRWWGGRGRDRSAEIALHVR